VTNGQPYSAMPQRKIEAPEIEMAVRDVTPEPVKRAETFIIDN